MFDLSGELTVILIEKVRERLSVHKQASQFLVWRDLILRN